MESITPRDLMNAKAVQNGRLAMGSLSIIYGWSMAYLSGNYMVMDQQIERKDKHG